MCIGVDDNGDGIADAFKIISVRPADETNDELHDNDSVHDYVHDNDNDDDSEDDEVITTVVMITRSNQTKPSLTE